MSLFVLYFGKMYLGLFIEVLFLTLRIFVPNKNCENFEVLEAFASDQVATQTTTEELKQPLILYSVYLLA